MSEGVKGCRKLARGVQARDGGRGLLLDPLGQGTPG
jgi:hypothetical protein